MHTKSILIPFIAILSIACCKSEKTPSGQVLPVTSASASPIVKPVVKTEQEILVDNVMSAKTIEESLKLTVPFMGGAKHDEFSEGHNLFVLWAEKNYSVKNLSEIEFQVSKNETSVGFIKKNPEKESGKKICVNGKIIQIKEMKNLSKGLIWEPRGGLYYFIGLNDSGDLTDKSSAKFCGYVTGTYDYKDSVGGTGHAISLVGMWQINKK